MALYGFILAPVGAIVVVDIFFFSKEEKKSIHNSVFNWDVLLAWLISVGTLYWVSLKWDIFLSFLVIPAWLSCGLIFLSLNRIRNARQA